VFGVLKAEWIVIPPNRFSHDTFLPSTGLFSSLQRMKERGEGTFFDWKNNKRRKPLSI
jgi:hypothetical protein